MRAGPGEPKDDRALIREALGKAAGDVTPDVSRLVAAVPSLMAEAGRRSAGRPDDLASILTERAWWAMPRLAAATALLAVFASILLVRESESSDPSATSLESVILDGGNGTSVGTGDVLLDAVLGARKSDG